MGRFPHVERGGFLVGIAPPGFVRGGVVDSECIGTNKEEGVWTQSHRELVEHGV